MSKTFFDVVMELRAKSNGVILNFTEVNGKKLIQVQPVMDGKKTDGALTTPLLVDYDDSDTEATIVAAMLEWANVRSEVYDLASQAQVENMAAAKENLKSSKGGVAAPLKKASATVPPVEASPEAPDSESPPGLFSFGDDDAED